MIAGYEPSRIAGLRWRTMASIGALDSIASTDPASDAAIAHVRAMRRALDVDMMGALTAIHDHDPLVRAGRAAAFGGNLDPRHRPMPSGHDIARRAPWHSNSDRPRFPQLLLNTEFSHLTLFELAMEVQFELTRQIENGVDLDDPFWTDTFPYLVIEFERRAASDPEFLDWVAEFANPLIGLIIAEGDFDDDVIVDVAAALLATGHEGPERDAYRGEAINALLEQIAADPAMSLDLLGHPDVVEALYTWNDEAWYFTDVPNEILTDLIVNGLVVAPGIDDEHLSGAYAAFANFVAVAGDEFDSGFEPAVGLALALALSAHVPAFLPAAASNCDFELRHGDIKVAIGSYDDVVDFVGALLRTPAAQAVVLTTFYDLAEQIADGQPGITARNVSAWVHLIDLAVENEDLEMAADAASTTAMIGIGTKIVDFVASQALRSTGAGAFAKLLVSMGIEFVGGRIEDTVDTDSIGLTDVDSIGEAIIKLELYREALAPGATFEPDATPDQIDAARRALAAVDALFDQEYVSYPEVTSAMVDLGLRTDGVIPKLADERFEPKKNPACDSDGQFAGRPEARTT